MVNFKTRYNNFTTFKTLLNAVGGSSAVENTDASWYTILYSKYGEYNLRYKESEADAELYARWQQFKNVFTKVLQAQKDTLENVIKSTNAQAIVDGDQQSVNLDQVLSNYFSSGNSNQLKPAILSVIGPYINQSNVIEEFYKIFADFFANVNTDTTIQKTNEFNVHQIMNSILGLNVKERIEAVERWHPTSGDYSGEFAKKADKTTVEANQRAINTNTVNITANDNDIQNLNSGLQTKADKTALNNKADKTALNNKADKTALNNYYDKTTSDKRFEAKGSGGLDSNFIELDRTNHEVIIKKTTEIKDSGALVLFREEPPYDYTILLQPTTNDELKISLSTSLKGILIDPEKSSITGTEKREPTNPYEFIQQWYYKSERQKAIEGVTATVREATGQQHLGFFFWTSGQKSRDRPWNENGDSNGLLGIEKNNDKYFLDSSNTNIFKQNKNYDIQINIFKNGGNNSSGNQLNLFATALNNPGSSQVQQDTLGVVQTFDSYQHPPGNNFGPSQTNKNWIIRETAWDFDDFNELTIKIRVRKLSNNQLVIRTTEPVRHFTKLNNGNYLYTRSDFVAKIANTGNGKFWKFGIRTGNWDNITRVEWFIRGEA